MGLLLYLDKSSSIALGLAKSLAFISFNWVSVVAFAFGLLALGFVGSGGYSIVAVKLQYLLGSGGFSAVAVKLQSLMLRDTLLYGLPMASCMAWLLIFLPGPRRKGIC